MKVTRRRGIRKFDTDKEWLSDAENRVWKRMVESGEVLFYRTDSCAGCNAPIPKGGVFKYCSLECKERSQAQQDERKDK